ncbi:hypothetical protein D3C73_1105450 [compost metagenome]
MGDADGNEIQLSFEGMVNLLFYIVEPLAFRNEGQLDEIMGMKRKLISLCSTVHVQEQIFFEKAFAFQRMVCRVHPSTPFSAGPKVLFAQVKCLFYR